MPDPTEARELLDLVNRAIVRSCNCGTKFSKPVKHELWCRAVALEKAASFISRTGQPQEVTTENESSLRVTDEMVARAWQAFDKWSGYSMPEKIRAVLTAALQVNPLSPPQGGH